MVTIIVGIAAGTLCTLSFIPQVVKMYRTKNVRGLSILTFSIFAAGVSLWLLYGILLKDAPIIIANMMTLALIINILILRLRYKDRK
jgi:MtN3 and saliva related transmembrane protein